MKYKLYIESYHITTREIDEDDEWDNGDDAYIDHKVRILPSDHKEKMGYPEMTFSAKPDDVIVMVIYDTGCTFGHTDGVHTLLGPMSKKTAEKLKNAIDARGDSGTMYETMKKLKVEGYPCWIGYFERLDRVLVLSVGDSSWQS